MLVLHVDCILSYFDHALEACGGVSSLVVADVLLGVCGGEDRPWRRGEGG